jgi:general secretion pathway protein H
MWPAARLNPDLGAARGFTLLELMIVVALIAIASAVASLALRDPSATRLEREATRLAALLESARAESRSMGLPVIWLPVPSVGGELPKDFQFVGLPENLAPGMRWLEAGVVAEVEGASAAAPGIILGPEPMLTPARIALRLGDQRLTLATDGLGPFEIDVPTSSGEANENSGAERAVR